MILIDFKITRTKMDCSRSQKYNRVQCFIVEKVVFEIATPRLLFR